MSATNVQALVELAGRVGAVTSPDRTLDCWIFGKAVDLVNGEPWSDGDCVYATTNPDETCAAPAYTSDLNAAISLVPEGHDWLRKGFSTMTVVRFGKLEKDWARHFDGTGATPALALCQASLLARAAIEGEG